MANPKPLLAEMMNRYSVGIAAPAIRDVLAIARMLAWRNWLEPVEYSLELMYSPN